MPLSIKANKKQSKVQILNTNIQKNKPTESWLVLDILI